jgi:hypothetical protein
VAALGVEYLRFADTLARRKAERTAAERHDALMDRLFKGFLVSTDRYEEKVLFPEHFIVENLDGTTTATTNDADVDFDYAPVEWQSPGEDELAILTRMLQDKSVSVPAEDRPEVPVNELPPPRDIPRDQIEQDREWV